MNKKIKTQELNRLPESWRVVKLKDIATMKAGGTPKRSIPEYWNGDIPFVLIEDITSCGLYLSKTKQFITNEGLKNSSAWIVPPRSLLLSMYATIGETAINTIPVATNQAILAIIPKKDLNVEFGAYTLNFYANELKKHTVQSTQKNINKGIVANFSIPLPPLPEQKAIVFVLRSVQEAKEATEKVIFSLRELKKSLMKHLFTFGPVPINQKSQVKLKETEVGQIPEHWEVVKLKEVTKFMKAGGTPKRSETKFWRGNIPFVLVRDLTSCGIYLNKTEETITEEGLNNSSAWLVPPRSLLLSMYATIGETAVNTIPVATNQAILALIPNDTFHVEFGAYLLKFHSKRLAKYNVQSTQKNINKGIVKNFPIPLPPIEEQEKIAEILKAVDEKIEAEEKRKEALESLFKSLLNNLMTAKIRLPEEFIKKFEEESNELRK